MTSLPISACHDHELTPSMAYTKYSISSAKWILVSANLQECLRWYRV
jgi:hypothetical protein